MKASRVCCGGSRWDRHLAKPGFDGHLPSTEPLQQSSLVLQAVAGSDNVLPSCAFMRGHMEGVARTVVSLEWRPFGASSSDKEAKVAFNMNYGSWCCGARALNCSAAHHQHLWLCAKDEDFNGLA